EKWLAPRGAIVEGPSTVSHRAPVLGIGGLELKDLTRVFVYSEGGRATDPAGDGPAFKDGVGKESAGHVGKKKRIRKRKLNILNRKTKNILGRSSFII